MPSKLELRDRRLIAILEPRLGHVPRPLPSTLVREVERLGEQHPHGVDGLLTELATRPRDPRVESLVSAATVGHTAFFRHPEQFRRLRKELAALRRPVRLWSAGCSTGEEAYSLAALAEHLGVPYSILGTDVDAEAIQTARGGRYGLNDGRFDLPSPDQGRGAAFLGGEVPLEAVGALVGRELVVHETLRTRVQFEKASVLDVGASRGTFDFVFCRNLLIYFDPRGGARLMESLTRSLRPGGVLVVSPVDALRPLPEGLTRQDPLGWLTAVRPVEREVVEVRRPEPSLPARPGARGLEIAARALGLDALEQAERHLHRLLDAHPAWAEAWFLLGEVLYRRGEAAQARAAFALAANHAEATPEGQTLARAAVRRSADDVGQPEDSGV